VCFAIDLQTGDRGPANCGEALNLAAFGGRLEMLFPAISPWVEQTDNSPAVWIDAAKMCRLPEITGATGQGPIGLGVEAFE
jgi:hypothetical protein